MAPTKNKPAGLGGFSLELSDATRKGWSWEIAHKKFEISRHRIMGQVRDLAKFFGETHSFHFHIVFELPKKYAHFSSFSRWFKTVNDYLYLRGLEEGLHGNYLTNVVNDSRDMGWIEKIKSTFSQAPSTKLLEKLSSVTRFGSKFFSMGLRGGDMYGPASSPEAVKVGLELRKASAGRSDPTIDNSRKYLKKSSPQRC